MYFPNYRARRLRQNENLRRMVRESSLSVNDLIYPLFVVPGSGIKEPISTMPGQYHFSVDTLVDEVASARDLGIPAVILFGLPETKDEFGSSGYAPDGIVQTALSTLKNEIDDVVLITDVCLCEYTSHGHCGVLKGTEVDNDATLELLAKQALSHAQAGADMVAPSDMMDGRVGVIRMVLDEEGYTNIPIMSYAAKFASAFYGPFREAAQSTPAFGDRRSYQMDPANIREALREVDMDIEEGADIIMVKPAMAFMDVISRVREETDLPVAAYSVSGEYAMIKAAAEKGWVDEKQVALELLTGIKRAGADMILTYFAPQAAGWLRER
ncbi:MAG: porphobilinogen synthase [Deltaproteobacteria bacterium]|nr:porphobilinogen synthase [Deltaproteobacteria bacterium]MBW2323437.1 porphobilinogen synthase [Deltaproteobacteria bacterium]